MALATPTAVGTGGTVRAYMASYDDFQWLDRGTFTDNAGRLEADSVDGEIPVIGTLVLISEL